MDKQDLDETYRRLTRRLAGAVAWGRRSRTIYPVDVEALTALLDDLDAYLDALLAAVRPAE